MQLAGAGGSSGELKINEELRRGSLVPERLAQPTRPTAAPNWLGWLTNIRAKAEDKPALPLTGVGQRIAKLLRDSYLGNPADILANVSILEPIRLMELDELRRTVFLRLYNYEDQQEADPNEACELTFIISEHAISGTRVVDVRPGQNVMKRTDFTRATAYNALRLLLNGTTTSVENRQLLERGCFTLARLEPDHQFRRRHLTQTVVNACDTVMDHQWIDIVRELDLIAASPAGNPRTSIHNIFVAGGKVEEYSKTVAPI